MGYASQFHHQHRKGTPVFSTYRLLRSEAMASMAYQQVSRDGRMLSVPISNDWLLFKSDDMRTARSHTHLTGVGVWPHGVGQHTGTYRKGTAGTTDKCYKNMTYWEFLLQHMQRLVLSMRLPVVRRTVNRSRTGSGRASPQQGHGNAAFHRATSQAITTHVLKSRLARLEERNMAPLAMGDKSRS